MNLRGLIAGLHASGIRHVVIGGVAANALGSARVTFDLDVCYDPADDNVQRLALLLGAWHAYLRGVEPGLPWTPDARAIRTSPVLTLVTDEGDLDLMDRVAGVGDYPAVLAASEVVSILGVPTNSLTLDALIASKRAAGRRKDREALLELEALRELRKRRGLP
jgi:predicted nucleotidyltransferase